MKAIEIIRPGQVVILGEVGEEMLLDFCTHQEWVLKIPTKEQIVAQINANGRELIEKAMTGVKPNEDDKKVARGPDTRRRAQVCADGKIILIDLDTFLKNLNQSAGWKKVWTDIDAMGREISAKAMAQIEAQKKR